MEQLIVVNDQDQEVDYQEKMHVHRLGLMHRAFSIFVCRNTGKKIDVLMQQRAKEKYHSQGLWSNTCCGHPLKGESTKAAAERRLKEEMGFSVSLKSIGCFHYKAFLENNLIENEIDHVFFGEYNGEPIIPNAEEVMDYKWISLKELDTSSDIFTVWISPATNILKKFIDRT